MTVSGRFAITDATKQADLTLLMRNGPKMKESLSPPGYMPWLRGRVPYTHWISPCHWLHSRVGHDSTMHMWRRHKRGPAPLNMLPLAQEGPETAAYRALGFQGGYEKSAVLPLGHWDNREAAYFAAIFPTARDAQRAAKVDRALRGQAQPCQPFTVHLPVTYMSCGYAYTEPGNHVTFRDPTFSVGRISIYVGAYTAEIGPAAEAQALTDAGVVACAIADRARDLQQ